MVHLSINIYAFTTAIVLTKKIIKYIEIDLWSENNLCKKSTRYVYLTTYTSYQLDYNDAYWILEQKKWLMSFEGMTSLLQRGLLFFILSSV